MKNITNIAIQIHNNFQQHIHERKQNYRNCMKLNRLQRIRDRIDNTGYLKGMDSLRSEVDDEETAEDMSELLTYEQSTIQHRDTVDKVTGNINIYIVI